LTTLPVIAAYIYLQKYMVEGLTGQRQRLMGSLTDLEDAQRGSGAPPADITPCRH